MKKLYSFYFILLLSVCVFISCKNNNNALKLYGMFDISDSIKTKNPIIDIKKINIINTKDSIFAEITVKKIPDSISFNNLSVKGYNEYYWDIEFDIDNDSIIANNVIVHIFFNHFYNESFTKPMNTTFKDFFKNSSTIISINDLPFGVHDYYCNNFYYKENTFYMHFPKNLNSTTLAIDTTTKWIVRTGVAVKENGSNKNYNEDNYTLTPDNFKQGIGSKKNWEYMQKKKAKK